MNLVVKPLLEGMRDGALLTRDLLRAIYWTLHSFTKVKVPRARGPSSEEGASAKN